MILWQILEYELLNTHLWVAIHHEPKSLEQNERERKRKYTNVVRTCYTINEQNYIIIILQLNVYSIYVKVLLGKLLGNICKYIVDKMWFP